MLDPRLNSHNLFLKFSLLLLFAIFSCTDPTGFDETPVGSTDRSVTEAAEGFKLIERELEKGFLSLDDQEKSEFRLRYNSAGNEERANMALELLGFETLEEFHQFVYAHLTKAVVQSITKLRESNLSDEEIARIMTNELNATESRKNGISYKEGPSVDHYETCVNNVYYNYNLHVQDCFGNAANFDIDLCLMGAEIQLLGALGVCRDLYRYPS